ncbi:MAG: superinfection immunity protein [Kineosporiaceae bacterium]
MSNDGPSWNGPGVDGEPTEPVPTMAPAPAAAPAPGGAPAPVTEAPPLRPTEPLPALAVPPPTDTPPAPSHAVQPYQAVVAPVPARPVAAPYGGYAQGLVTDQRSPDTALVVVAWLLAIGTLLYLLPWAIAVSRGKANHAAIGLVNVLLGWSFIGWIVALVMACGAHQVGGHSVAVAYAGQPYQPQYQPQPVYQPAYQPQPTALPPAGWYAAPDGQGRQYWDGRAWTPHRSA